MTSVRKRKMNKSSIGKATRRNKDRQRKINITGNPVIAANWDYSLTLKQNYKKLGLRAKLQRSAGGVEADLTKERKKEPLVKFGIEEESDEENSGSEKNLTDEEFDPQDIPTGEARIKRDQDGNVVEVVYGQKKTSDTYDNEEASKNNAQKVQARQTDVIKQLEEIASAPMAKKERTLSTREEEWLERLYYKHSENYRNMFFDTKLNIYQQSEGDLRRRILAWKQKHSLD